MESSSEAVHALAQRFAGCFRETLRPIRLIGREAEFPVVWPDGRAADVLQLWEPLLQQGGFSPQYDDPETRALIVGLQGPGGAVEVEVGRATVELVLGPYEDLWQLQEGSARLTARVVDAANAAGMRILGFGIQPRTRGSLALMTPKRRYFALSQAIGRPWFHLTTTASDQVQVDITREELVDSINVLNVLSAPLIALTANSSVYGGRSGRYLSGREGLLGNLGEFRAGMTPRPFSTVEEFIAYLCRYSCYVLRDGAGFHAYNRPFEEYLAAHGPDFAAYLLHEHYVWNSARPRVNNSTIEVRPACQQPREEPLAVAALSLGLVEGLSEAKAFLHAVLGDGLWIAMRRYRAEAIIHGVRAREPVPDFLKQVLHIAQEGLARRNRGEEIFLGPLWERLNTHTTPGERNREILRQHGMDAFLRATAFGL